MAVATGKSLPFPHPYWPDYRGNNTAGRNVGLEGGVHNLLRYLESWDGVQSHYKGSLVSLFLVQYNTGIYKDGGYKPPIRDYSFDDDFRDLSKLPPGTPTFRDIVNLSFAQSYTPR
jgi:hypothetical protein